MCLNEHTIGSYWACNYENLSLYLQRCFPLKNILVIPNILGPLLHNVKNHVQNYFLLPRRHKYEQQKNNIMKKEFQSSCYCLKQLHCNQIHKQHYPQNGHHLPNSSPPSKSQMIRTMMMINEVAPTTAVLWITLWFYYFQLLQHIC